MHQDAASSEARCGEQLPLDPRQLCGAATTHCSSCVSSEQPPLSARNQHTHQRRQPYVKSVVRPLIYTLLFSIAAARASRRRRGACPLRCVSSDQGLNPAPHGLLLPVITCRAPCLPPRGWRGTAPRSGCPGSCGPARGPHSHIMPIARLHRLRTDGQRGSHTPDSRIHVAYRLSCRLDFPGVQQQRVGCGATPWTSPLQPPWGWQTRRRPCRRAAHPG